MITTRRCSLCTSDNYLEDGALSLHQQLVHQISPIGGSQLVLAQTTLGTMTQRAKMILCAHADLDGRGAHWRLADEPCWVDQVAGVDL